VGTRKVPAWLWLVGLPVQVGKGHIGELTLDTAGQKCPAELRGQGGPGALPFTPVPSARRPGGGLAKAGFLFGAMWLWGPLCQVGRVPGHG
jgi:hypothetical protein